MLLLPRRTLDRDWLVRTLWNGEAPASASHLLPHYVWRLRELLPGGAELLRTVPSGYRFELVDDDLDGPRFQRLVTEGRRAAAAGGAEQAIGTLSAALDLWRGPALAAWWSAPSTTCPSTSPLKLRALTSSLVSSAPPGPVQVAFRS